jgi:hypothetical protein
MNLTNRRTEMKGTRLSMSRLLGFTTVLICAIGLLVSTNVALAEKDTQSELTAIAGEGSGRVIVSPTAEDDGTFAVEITINIHDAAPDTTFFVRRAPDLNPNGICTGNFIPFTGETLTSSAGGAGATHFFFERGAPFVSGTRFNVVFQVYTPDGTTILESDCMTITVK